ncbi:hypothetical protein ANCDUO_01839 [Ancylostoma duodenale]|uniref:Uncharacterized protein n=1 Tax=Ancylostoma duodenale TaxID=51022 RepID=A0A0C2DD89_9BILA|nr:hypothetical protein ANCDUO_01839 [Ancylostoma duodenale]
MVCAGITYTGRTPLIFVPERVKVYGLQYRAIPQTRFCFGPDGILKRRCGSSNRMAPHLESSKKNGILKSIACAKLHSTIEALKRDLTKPWNVLPMDIIARAGASSQGD